MKRFNTARKTAAIGLSLGLATIAITGGNAHAATPAAGTGSSTSEMSLVNLQLGANGSLLGIKVLPDSSKVTTDPKVSAPSAEALLAALKVSSSLVPALNVTLPTNGLATKSPGGSSTAHGSAVSLPASLSALGTGSVLPGDLTSIVDTDGARSSLAGQITDLSLLAGLAKVHSLTSSLTNGSAATQAANTRTLHLDALTGLNLGALLAGLGIPLDKLGVNTVSALVTKLGVPVAGLPVNETLASAVGGLQASIAQVNTAINNAGTTVDQTLNTTLGGLLAPVGITPPAVGALLTTTLTNLTTALSNLLGAALTGLDAVHLLELDGLNLSVTTQAKNALSETTNGASASFGALKVAGVTLPGLSLDTALTTVQQVVDQANGTLDQVLSLINAPGVGSLAGLLRVQVLAKDLPAPTTVNGYNRALAGLSVLSVSITPPAFLANLIAGLGTSVGSLTSSLPALPGVDAIGQIQGPNGLLGGTVTALSQGASLQLVSVQSASEFVPNAVTPQAPTVTPTPTNLPRTGGNTTPLLAFGAVLVAVSVGARRSIRASRTK